MIGLGLWDAKDVSVKALEIIKNCDYVYLESYTSKLGCSVKDLEKLYGKKIIVADRKMVEIDAEDILDQAKENDVAFLIMGDVFAATTHMDITHRAEKRGIDVKVIHNASVLTAIGETGLELYKFGRTVSIPFENEKVISPIDFFKQNFKLGLHTLFLLDLRPDEDKFMTINEAIEYLRKNGVRKYFGVGCAGLGSDKPEIKVGLLQNLVKVEFTKFPQCLIIPGKLHFIEEDTLKKWQKK